MVPRNSQLCAAAIATAAALFEGAQETPTADILACCGRSLRASGIHRPRHDSQPSSIQQGGPGKKIIVEIPALRLHPPSFVLRE